METTIREPAVAGLFYPVTRDELSGTLDELLETVEPQHDMLACVAPHAGYVYSGSVAGNVFGHVRIPRRVIVLGPNHTGGGSNVSVSPHSAWHTPLGNVPVDADLAEQLVHRHPAATFDIRAHWREHSIEVQLPFLRHLRPDVQVLPVCLKHLSLAECTELGHELAAIIAGADEPVAIVASSDMTHYEPEKEARRRDQDAIDAALTLEPARLYETVHRQRISMCGVIASTVALVAAAELGATGAHLVDYATSGDVSRDMSSVVGYAGICIHGES